MIALITSVVLIGLMIVGVPVAASMGITSMGIFAALGQEAYLAVAPQRIFVGATSVTMLAIPFFILAGNLMNTGGITDRIFNFAKACCGHWPGGLGQVNIVSSLIFSGMSGSAVADAAGLGAIEIKAMEDAGFDRKFAAGITAASSTIGPVIPPSIPFVVYASTVSCSVGALFLAGAIPGFLMAVAMGISVYWLSKKRGYPVEPKMPLKMRLIYFWHGIPSLMTIVIIVGGIWGGWFTATEAAVVASAYAFILSVCIYRELDVKGIYKVMRDSMLQSCKTLFIIAVANFLAYFLTHQRIPNMVIEGLTTVTDNRYLLILIIIFVLLILGCFIEGTAVILIATPIFLPVINQIGMDHIQFGVIMILASMIGLLTPPVGMSLYAVASICKIQVTDLAKEVIPYLIGIFGVLLAVAFFEPIAMFLPNLLM